MTDLEIADPAVVVLVGVSGSGKSTWAAERYRAVEVVASDALRGIVGSGPGDQSASADAFLVLNQILAARTKRRLTTVVDTTGLEPERRRGYLEAARAGGLPAVLVIMDTPASVCRARNAARERKVPAAVIDEQLRLLALVHESAPNEGWDAVLRVAPAASTDPERPQQARDRSTAVERSSAPLGELSAGRGGLAAGAGGLRVVLQIARLPSDAEPADWLSEVALAADRLGFDGIALMDHLIQIPQVGRVWDPIPQPWVTLGLLAGLDTRLRLGTLVSPVTFHSPGVLAKTVATLDALSGGRAFCGLGAGWWGREHEAYGVPFPPAAERLDRLETTIETMRALWAPGTKAFRGSRVSLPETTCYPRPVGPVPIIVGGSGERRTLRIAAELADGCNVGSDLDTLPRKIAVLHDHCAAVGRDPSEVEITVLDVAVIGRDREDAARRVERLRGRTAASTYAARHHAGTVDAHVQRYRQLAGLGVGTVFLSLPDLSGADDLTRCEVLVAATRAGEHLRD